MTFISFVTVVALAACGGKAKGPESGGEGKPLYDRLGGKDAITAVVKDFVEERVAKDKRINHYFANADIPKLEGHLVDQICAATGGPCKYTGRDMITVHTNMKVTKEAFDATVEDLKASLDHFKVPEQEQKELLGALAAMESEIINR